MSFWKNLSSFVKNVLHRDDDYALCQTYANECENCPKKDTCKKASFPKVEENELLRDQIQSGSR